MKDGARPDDSSHKRYREEVTDNETNEQVTIDPDDARKLTENSEEISSPKDEK